MPTKNALLALFMALTLGCSTAFADELVLNPDHPERYVVVKGDTLWDISSHFLRDAWRWPEIWHINPDINNPHLIYPGDVIYLTYRDGRPVLELQRGLQAIKLSPKIRSSKLSEALPAIPPGAIKQFLKRPLIISENELENSGYLISAEDKRLISGVNNKIYVRNLNYELGSDYRVFRLNHEYYNPNDEDDLLGYEVIHVSNARLVREGDPATLVLTEAFRETLLGDRVMPASKEHISQGFMPHAPLDDVRGTIISIMDGVSRAGQYQAITINLGTQENIERGHVLAIYQSGRKVRDTISRRAGETIALPEERTGLVMVFKVFERVSYALIMNATRDIRIGDTVTSP